MQDNPAANMIEEDIVRTQNEMSDTVNELQEKLHPQQLFRQTMGNPREVPGQVFEAVKRNPAAAGLIAIGGVWLVSGKQLKMPSMKANRFRRRDSDGYQSHLATIHRYDGESDDAYQSRFDSSRASYFGTERGADEAPHSFKERLDGLAGGLRQKASGTTGRAGQFMASFKGKGQNARDWSVQQHDSSPLMGGIAALAVGAIAGLALPKTEVERQKLAPLRDTALNKASALKDQALQAAGDKLDQAGSPREAEMAG